MCISYLLCPCDVLPYLALFLPPWQGAAADSAAMAEKLEGEVRTIQGSVESDVRSADAEREAAWRKLEEQTRALWG